jgi:hypothetical protein
MYDVALDSGDGSSSDEAILHARSGPGVFGFEFGCGEASALGIFFIYQVLL